VSLNYCETRRQGASRGEHAHQTSRLLSRAVGCLEGIHTQTSPKLVSERTKVQSRMTFHGWERRHKVNCWGLRHLPLPWPFELPGWVDVLSVSQRTSYDFSYQCVREPWLQTFQLRSQQQQFSFWRFLSAHLFLGTHFQLEDLRRSIKQDPDLNEPQSSSSPFKMTWKILLVWLWCLMSTGSKLIPLECINL